MSLQWVPLGEYDGEVWYRVEDHLTTAGPMIHTRSIPVLRHTPKGVWLDEYGLQKFVLKDARKRWACPTLDEAWASFYARKRRQRKILRAQLRHVEAVLEMADEKGTAA